MKHNTKLQKSFILSLLLIVFAAGNLCAADDPLMNLLPDSCLFCVRVNDFNSSLGKLDTYLAGTSPIPMSMAMLVNMQLIGVTGDPMLNGIDQGGDFALFGMLNPDKTAGMPVFIGGVLIPVKSYADFIKNNPNCKPGENGTSILSAPNSPMGNVVLTEVANGQYALVVSEMQKGTLEILKSALSALPKPLSAKLNASQSQNAATAPAWAYVNLALLYDTYQSQVLTMLQEAQGKIETADKGMAEMVGFTMKMYAEAFKEFAGDADSVTIALTPEPAVLSIDTVLRAKDGSEMAGMLAADPKTSKTFTMAGYLDDASAINGLMKMNLASMEKMYNKMFDIMAATTEDPSFKEQTEKMKAMIKKGFAAVGDEVAFSFSYAGGKPPIKLREVVAVKDSAAMKALMNDNIECANLMYQAMGFPATFKYQPGVSTYKGIPIDTATIEMKMTGDPNDPMEAAVKQMYGDSFAYYMAQTPDKFYMTMGSDSQETLKAMLDQPVAAAAPTGDIKTAMDTLQNTPYTDLVCSVNIIKLMKGLGEMLQTMSGPEGVPGMPNFFASLKDVPSQSSMVLGGRAAEGQIALRAALPKQHLTEIITAAMKIQQQAMGAQQQQPQPAVTPSQPSSSSPQPQDSNALMTPPAGPQEGSAEELKSWIGKPAPEIRMVDLQGNIHRVTRLKGTKVLLDFWATWCPPCKESIPYLVELRGKTNENELTILGLSDEPADRLGQFAKDAKMNYPVILYNEKLPAPYGQITALPTVFMIDTKGVIRDIIVGYQKPQDIQVALDKIN
jgi:thiol-disulfide isomerase/thioredoxin